MKLRTIILIISLLALLSTLAGGYFYYSALKNATIDKMETQTAFDARLIRNHLENKMAAFIRAAKSLSYHQEIQRALSESSQKSLSEANIILDNFNDSFETSVTYLMDRSGTTIASSNRNRPDSFVGKNYSFRPYFKKAMQGIPSAYPAVGITSGKRGIYFSRAVYLNGQTAPAGVIVLKAPVDLLEKNLLECDSPGTLSMLVGPNNVIFMSNRKKYLLHLLDKLPQEQINTIVQSKQFGNTPLEWSGLERTAETRRLDASGNLYVAQREELPALPGWYIVHLHHVNEALNAIQDPLKRNLGPIIIALCALIGLSVALLYRVARADIVKRKEAEYALQASENRYRSLVESSADHIFMMDRTGTYRTSNGRVGQFGLERGQSLIGRNVNDIYPPETAALYKTKVDQVFQTAAPVVFEHPLTGTDGNHHHIDTLYPISRDGEVWAVGGICRDITKEKKAEAKLLRNQKFLREAAAIAHLGAWVWNMKDNSEWWSEEQFRIFGYDPGEIEPHHDDFLQLLHPEDKEAVLQAIQRSINHHQPYEMEYRIVLPDGSHRFISALAHIERSDEGEPLRMKGTVLDITKRKLIELALKENEERLRSISASVNEALIVIDDKAFVRFWNPAAENIFGYGETEVLGKEVYPFLASQDHMKRFVNEFAAFTASGEGKTVGKTIEMTALRKDGSEFPIELSLSSYVSNNRRYAVGSIRDISERKLAEKEREKLISSLTAALEEVRQLSGLLPICSHCKKIRDDKGYWKQIEIYIEEHSQAEFSHSICRECAEKYYPDMDIFDD